MGVFEGKVSKGTDLFAHLPIVGQPFLNSQGSAIALSKEEPLDLPSHLRGAPR